MPKSSLRVLITGSSLSANAMASLTSHGITHDVIEGNPSSEELIAKINSFDPSALIVRAGDINAEVITAAANLRLIAKHGVGYDNIDVEKAHQRGIPVIIARGANTVSVAEHTLSLILCLSKEIPKLNASIHSGQWLKASHKSTLLTQKTVGVVGFGQIAQHLVTLLAPFKTDVLACVRQIPDHNPSYPVSFFTSLHEMLPLVDVLSLHCPLTKETRHLIGSKELSLLKSSSIVINTARGKLIDQDALYIALKERRIHAAGLDCFEQEPVPASEPLLTLPSVVATPHIAWATHESAEAMGNLTVENVINILCRGEPPAERFIVKI